MGGKNLEALERVFTKPYVWLKYRKIYMAVFYEKEAFIWFISVMKIHYVKALYDFNLEPG